MIRFMHCVKRRPELTPEEFRRYWNSRQFVELLESLGPLAGARRIERNLTLIIDMNMQLMRERGSEEPFDAILEVWFDNARMFDSNKEGSELDLLLQEMEAFQERFIDFGESMRFFTEWNPPENGSTENTVF